MATETHPVVIVGGGPVGLGLAIDLGQRGVECLVIERRVDITRIPKGQNLTQRTMEHFASWGVENAIVAARQMPEDYPNSGVTAYGDLMQEWSYPWWRRSTVADYYSRPNQRIPQYETERVLRERIASMSAVETMIGWSADEISDGHTVHISNRESGRQHSVVGRYVVGADGSHSSVRELVGIPQDMSDHDRRMVLLVFRSPELNDLLDRFGQVSFFNIMDPALDGYWKFLGRVDSAGHFFFHAPVPADATEDSFDFAGLLHESVGTSFDVDFEYVGFWDLRFAIASRYRKSDVFMAGDAAHSHPPYGGYGINTGFEDARNLGWKLAATLNGWGSEALLDSYDAERRPVFASTASDFIEKMIDGGRSFISAHDPERDLDDFEAAWEERKRRAGMGVGDFAPHYEGSPLVGGEGAPSAVGSHELVARPGHHLPPGDGVFDRLGPGFSLVIDGRPADGFVGGASALGVPLDVVDGSGSGYGSPLVLVRPDHFVAWTGDRAGLAQAREILERACGR